MYKTDKGENEMTEKELRQKPVKWLQKFLGTKQGSTKHKEILKVFNDSGLCSRYKMTVKDAWCATTVSAAFIATDLTKIFPCVECSCSAMIEKAKKAGIWVEKDSYKPKEGDVIMYDWDDNGNGDDTGAPEHVGLDVSVTNGIIKVIEGNMGVGEVGYRDVPINGRYIRGFITPKYASIATKELPILDKTGYKKGDKDLGVLALKELLRIAKKKKLITAKFDENTTFGNGTEKAVNELLKKWSYKETGIAGEKFIKKLFEKCN